MPVFSTSRRDLFRFAFGAAAATGLAGLSTTPAMARDVVIGEGLAASWGPFYVADRLNLWQAQGLTPKVVTFASGRLVLDALVGGSVLFGTAAETPVVFANINGLPVRIIATLNRYEPFAVVTSKDITDIKALKGKKIGYSQGTNAHYYLYRLLDKAGLTLNDVTVVSLNPSDFVTSLVNGALDAFIWSEPHISKALAEGKGRFHALVTPGLYSTFSSVITTQKTIDEQPEVLISALKALLAADVALHKDEEAAIGYVSDAIKLDPQITRGFWGQHNFQVSLDKPALVEALTSQAKWAIANRLVRPDAQVPDFNAVVVDSLIAAARKG